MADTKYQLDALADFTSWEQNFFDTQRVSGNNKLCITAQKRGPIMDFVNKGCAAVQVSNGSGNDQLDPVIPKPKRWVLTGRHFFINGLGGKDYRQWTSDDAVRGAYSWHDIRDVAYITADTDEGEPGKAIIYADGPGNWKIFHNTMGDLATAKGQIYFGQYSGSIHTFNLSSAQIRSIFTSNQNVFNWLKNGGEYSICPYWSTEGYKHYGTILNAYDRGPLNYNAREVELVLQFEAGRMGMLGSGYNQPIGVYSEGVDNEINVGSGTVGHSGYYTRLLPNGGKVIGVSWPGASLAFMRFKAFMSYVFGYYLFEFKPIAMFGGDPNRIKPDSDTTPIFHYYPEGSNNNPPRANPLQPVDDQNQPAPYPPHMLGFENAAPAMDQVWEFCKSFVGNSNHYYPTISVGGNAATPSSPTDVRVLADYKDKQHPIAKFGANDSNTKQWLYGMSHRECTATFIMGGVSKTLNLKAGQDFFYTFD